MYFVGRLKQESGRCSTEEALGLAVILLSVTLSFVVLTRMRMGQDVGHDSGVLLEPSALAPLFRSDKLAVQFAAKLRRFRTSDLDSVSSNGKLILKILWEGSEDSEATEDRGTVDERLAQIRSGAELLRFMIDLLYANQDGEVGRYGETYIRNDEILVDLWNLYLTSYGHCAKTNLPAISEVTTFGSGRNCDWVVDRFGHPYLVFSGDDVFETVLTQPGKVLQDILETELHLSDWTWVSN